MDDATIQAVLRRLEAIEARLDRLEGAATVALPPVVSAPPPAVSPLPRANVSAGPPPMYSEEAEYFVGAKVLPRAGAAVLLLMFAYFVSIAYDRGWIGPQTIFAGAALLCVLLIGLGQWRRNEREEYGQILTGIGSCGLYLDFAGGHVFQKLYSGETMIALFVALSFANLGYSLWRASKPFLAIGAVGGFTAALMPLDRHRPEISLALLGIILAPAAYIAARNRWTESVLALWLASALTTVPIGLDRQATWQMAVAALETSGLVGLVAYSWASRDGEGQAPAQVAALGIFLTGLGAFALREGAEGVLHITIYAAAAGATALAARRGATRTALLAGAAATGFVLAPFGLPAIPAIFTCVGLGALCALASARLARNYALSLGAVEILLAAGRYSAASISHPLPIATDGLFLATGFLVCLAAGRLARRSLPDAESGFLLLALAFLGRGGYLSFVSLGWLEPNFAVTAALLLASVAALALGFWRELPNLRQLSFAGFAMTSLKALAIDLAYAAPFVRVGLLFALGVVLLAGGYWYIRRAAKRTT